MGYHAWVRIEDFLKRVEGSDLGQRASERRAIIGEALNQARPILEEATGYSSAGRLLMDALKQRHDTLST